MMAPEDNASLIPRLGPGAPVVFRVRTCVRLVEDYDSTETHFVIAITASGAQLNPAPRDGQGDVGLPGERYRRARHRTASCAAGEKMPRVHGHFTFASGYFNMPELTEQAWRNRWFHTGERAVREADGTLRFTDLLKVLSRTSAVPTMPGSNGSVSPTAGGKPWKP